MLDTKVQYLQKATPRSILPGTIGPINHPLWFPSLRAIPKFIPPFPTSRTSKKSPQNLTACEFLPGPRALPRPAISPGAPARRRLYSARPRSTKHEAGRPGSRAAGGGLGSDPRGRAGWIAPCGSLFGKAKHRGAQSCIGPESPGSHLFKKWGYPYCKGRNK